MSVINESQAGDELICITEFSGPPQGERSSPQSNRTFRIGERVRYVSFFRHPNLTDNPVCWNIVFEAADGKRYAATQTLFVTEDCWERIKKYFARRLLREPKEKPATRSQATGDV
jgi:hypothetical protein